MVITTLLYSADNRVCVIVDNDQTVFAMLVGEVGVVEEEEAEEGHHLRDKETYIEVILQHWYVATSVFYVQVLH